MTLEFKPTEFSEQSSVVTIDIPKGNTILQVTGGVRKQIKVKGRAFPGHPEWRTLDDIIDAYNNQDSVNVTYGGTTYTDYKITTLVWMESGGLVEEREFSLTLTKVV